MNNNNNSTKMSKVELDIEQHVLTQRKRLSDGTEQCIFTRNGRNPSGEYSYNCHLCGVANLTGEKSLQTHITGRKHQTRLIFDYTPDAVQFRALLVQKPNLPTTIFPGEPVPPGFEDEIKPEAQIQSAINKFQKPLVGLEYVIELVDSKSREPAYTCILCNKRGDPRNIMNHIVSQNHRMKFLEKHFAKVMSKLNRDRKFNSDMVYREQVLTTIVGNIEKHMHRLKPFVYNNRDFELRSVAIQEEINRGTHLDEKNWIDCEKILFNVSEFEQVSSDEETEFDNYKLQHTEGVMRDSHNSSPSHKVQKSVRISRFNAVAERASVSNDAKKILTPKKLIEQSEKKMKETYVWEKYRYTVDLAIEEMNAKFKEYEKNPEKHPLYSDEWKSFWSKRYKEILSEGKLNPNNYDYKPEWVKYWTVQMRKLHEADVQKKKNEIRKKMNEKCIGDEFKIKYDQIASSSKDSAENYGRSKSPKRKSRSPRRSPIRRSPERRRSRSPRRSRKHSDSPIKISDSDDDDKRRPYAETRQKRTHTGVSRRSAERSRSRFSDESLYSYRRDEYRSHDNANYDNYNKMQDYGRQSHRNSPPEMLEDGPVNMVSVCRLLSALEQDLGSLASRVIDMMAKALSLEKIKPNSADELLYVGDYYLILETVKEKLKGQLSVNLLSPNRIGAAKRAIQNIATLLHQASKKQSSFSTEQASQESFETELNKDPPDDGIDRVAIAQAITDALVRVGRTDISSEELEILIESYIENLNEDTSMNEVERPPVSVSSPKKTINSLAINPAIELSKPSAKKIESPRKDQYDSTELENLTDGDLKTLLRNFADLTPEEQSHLIAYLAKIEQTNPARVEQLRKYVNIGDRDEDDPDFVDKNNEMAGVSHSNKDRKKSPEPIKQILSDDEYDDDAVVKQLNAINGQSSNGNDKKSKTLSASGQTLTLSDTSGLADDLMNSLIQSSNQSQSIDMYNNMGMGSGVNMASAYYQQSLSGFGNDQYSQMMYDGLMGGVPMGMMPMPVQQQRSDSSWPQNAASSFGDLVPIHNLNKQFDYETNSSKNPFRKRKENINNRQLSGKGNHRNHDSYKNNQFFRSD